MDNIQKNMLVPVRPSDEGKEVLRHTHFSNILECESMRERVISRLGNSDSTVVAQKYVILQ